MILRFTTYHQVRGSRCEVLAKSDQLQPKTYNLTPNFDEGEIL